MLTELKLKVGKTTEASSETVEKGVILAQSPVGGSKLQANMSVDITVSSGKAEDSSEGGSNGRFLLSAEAEKSDGTRVSVFSQKLSAQDMASKDYWIEYPAGTVVLHVLVNGQEQFSVTLG